MKRAVFLDRDGTLMEEVGYCADPALVRVFPGVPRTLLSLQTAGYLLIVVTNQSGIGRGYFTEQDYRSVQEELDRQLLPARIDAAYFCPDGPDTPSQCRKPEPGMLFQAAGEHSIDLSCSYMIGDKASDMECGRAAGCRTILMRTGYGRKASGNSADAVAETFLDAIAFIMNS